MWSRSRRKRGNTEVPHQTVGASTRGHEWGLSALWKREPAHTWSFGPFLPCLGCLSLTPSLPISCRSSSTPSGWLRVGWAPKARRWPTTATRARSRAFAPSWRCKGAAPILKATHLPTMRASTLTASCRLGTIRNTKPNRYQTGQIKGRMFLTNDTEQFLLINHFLSVMILMMIQWLWQSSGNELAGLKSKQFCLETKWIMMWCLVLCICSSSWLLVYWTRTRMWLSSHSQMQFCATCRSGRLYLTLESLTWL